MVLTIENKTPPHGESWRVVEGSGNMYMVSNHGRIMSKKSNPEGVILKQRTHIGYKHICLNYGGKRNYWQVHRLVASHFIENKENKPVVNHLDGVKTNNHVDNLSWATVKENIDHAVDNGLYGTHSRCMSRLDVINVLTMYERGYSYRKISNETGGSVSNVRDIINGVAKFSFDASSLTYISTQSVETRKMMTRSESKLRTIRRNIDERNLFIIKSIKNLLESNNMSVFASGKDVFIRSLSSIYKLNY